MHSTLKQVPSKGTIRRFFKRVIFGSHVHCPSCRSRSFCVLRAEERWRCSRCHLPFSIKSSSWLKGAKLPLEDIWVLLWCWQREFPLKHAQAVTGLSYPTVSSWYGRFRDHVPPQLLEQTVLSGEIACDELYTGHQAVIGAKEKGTRNIALRVIHAKSVNKSDAMDFLQRYATPGSHVCTDGSRIYRGMDQWCRLRHSYEIHKKFEFTLTSEIEGLWGVFRTFVRRMYHHVTRYKLQKTVSEFTLRFRQHKLFQSPDEYLRFCLKPNPFAC
jgi:transposase-like protein